MNQTEPVVHLKFAQEGDSVRFQYEVQNSLDQPIYVFDRLYDMRSQKLSPDWAYVAVDGQRAVICRQVWPLPNGLRHESPETPYGRLIAPKGALAGKFSLSLPLVERDPYYSLVHTNQKLAPANITSLVFRLGWGIASHLRAGSEVELESEKLVLFPFHEALAKQHLAESNAATVKISISVSR